MLFLTLSYSILSHSLILNSTGGTYETLIVVGTAVRRSVRQWRNPFAGQTEGMLMVIAGGLIYGFTYFLTVVEAGTAPLGVPFAIVVTVFGLIWGRKQFKRQPMTTFFVVGYGLATLLIVIWAIWQGGLPEFSEVGIIQ